MSRRFKNKHQAVSQGRYKLEARGLRLEAQNKFRPGQPSFELPASSRFYVSIYKSQVKCLYKSGVMSFLGGSIQKRADGVAVSPFFRIG
jgi:hypothetical protein